MNRTKASHTFLTEGITAEEMAGLLSITKRRVGQLAADGIIKRLGRDRYSPIVAGYAEYRAKLVQEKQTKTVTSVAIDSEKLRRLRQSNDRAESRLIAMPEVTEFISWITENICDALPSIASETDVPESVKDRLVEQVQAIKNLIHKRMKRELALLSNPRRQSPSRRAT